MEKDFQIKDTAGFMSREVMKMIEEREIVSPLVSVIIPVYNTEKYLRQCVESAILQTYQALEIILVDDGSTDGCGILCDTLASEDGRIRAIHKPNGGQSSARNVGIGNAVGKYLYFLDSDDYILPELIGKLVNKAESSTADVVFFEGQSFVDPEDEKLAKKIVLFEYSRKTQYETADGITQFWKQRNNLEYFVCTPLHFYRKEYLDRYGIRFEEGIVHEDDLFSAAVYLHNGTFTHLLDDSYMRRLRPQSTMTSQDEKAKLYKFQSLVRVYYGIARLIQVTKPPQDIVSVMISDRLETIRKNYNNMPKKIRKKQWLRFVYLKKHAFILFGLHDYSIARKCAGPISKPLVRGFHFLYCRFKEKGRNIKESLRR